MDSEIIVSSLIEKLNENKSAIDHHIPIFGNPFQTAIESLSSLREFLKEGYYPMNGSEMAWLLKAVYSAEDAIDNLLTPKQQRQQREIKRKMSLSAREGEGILMKKELEREEKELWREKEELKREEEELKREEKELRRGLEESQRKKEELGREKEELEKEEKELRIRLEELEREKEKCKKEKEEEEMQLRGLQRQNEVLQKAKEEFQRENEEKLKKNEALQRDKEKLQREKEEALRNMQNFSLDEELQLIESRLIENKQRQTENEEFLRDYRRLLDEREELRWEELVKGKGRFRHDPFRSIKQGITKIELERLEEEYRREEKNLQRKEKELQIKGEELESKKEKSLREMEDFQGEYENLLEKRENLILRKEKSLDKIWKNVEEMCRKEEQREEPSWSIELLRIETGLQSLKLSLAQRKEMRRKDKMEELQLKEKKEQRRGEIQRENDQLLKGKEQLQRENKKLLTKKGEFLREMKKLNKDNQELREEKERLKMEEKELRKIGEEESQRKENELRRLKEELQRKERELQIKREQLEERKEKWQRKDIEEELRMRKNKDWQREKEELLKENEAFQRKNEEMLRKNLALQRDNVKLLRENEELLRDIQKLKKDNEELQRRDEKVSGEKEPSPIARKKCPRRRMNILRRKVFKWPFMRFKPLRYLQIDLLLEMKKLRSEVQALGYQNQVKGGFANNTDRGQQSQAQRWGKISRFCLEESRVIGFEEQIEDLVGKLLTDSGQLQQGQSPQPQVIKLIGKPGSGKTTLIRTVCNKLEVKQHFSTRAWVHISSITKFRDLWIDLLKTIEPSKLAQEAFSEEEMLSRLVQLLRNSKYLIVIDQDVENEKSPCWQALTKALCSSCNKGKIIIITQEEEKEKQKENNPRQEYYLTVKSVELKEEESWKLFSEKAGLLTENDDPDTKPSLDKFKDKILSICNGSPLRLVMLGGLFSTKKNESYDEWLKCFTPASNTDEDIWDLCYQDLPSEIKPCFLYMVLFPRGFEIPVRRLIHLWCAEVFSTSLAHDGQETAPEDLAEMYFEELVIRNMIQVRWRLDGSPKTCRMPGALHNAFCRKATGFGFLYNQLHSSHKSTRRFNFARRFAAYLSTNNEVSSNPFFHFRHLRTYIAFDTRIQGKSSIETSMLLKRVTGKRWFRLLKVLDLEGVYKPRNIDMVLEHLLRLSYLGLRSTFIDSLPDSVSELQCLETLDLKHTRIRNIPNQVWNARKLKHLYLSWINGVADFTSTPTQLPNLHTLRGLYWRYETSFVMESLENLGSLRKLGLAYNSSNNGSVSEKVSKLTSLQSLKLRYINEDDESEARYLTLKKMNEHQKLQDLYLRGQLNPGFVIDTQFFPSNLKTLTFSMSRLEVDPMPVLGQLPHLNILRLYADSYVGKEMTCLGKGFPKLRVLKLWKLPELEACILGKEAMPCLQELEIRSCTTLTTLKFIEDSEYFTSLNEIILTNMPFNLLRSLPIKNGYVKHVKL